MRKVNAILAACAVGSALSQSADGSIIYLQNFSATAGQAPLSSVDWNAYYGNASTAPTLAVNGSTGVPANAMLSGAPSGPTPDGANVNANQSTSAITNGFVPLLSQNGGQQFLAYTTAFPIDQSAYTSLSFNWYAATAYNTSGGDFQRLAVQVGGNWYASKSPIVGPPIGTVGTAFQTGSGLFTTPLSTGWETLNTSSSLSQGVATSLPGGVISAYGLFIQIGDTAGQTNERSYFDTFEVTANAVPEPASGCGAIMLAGELLRRRRRSRS